LSEGLGALLSKEGLQKLEGCHDHKKNETKYHHTISNSPATPKRATNLGLSIRPLRYSRPTTTGIAKTNSAYRSAYFALTSVKGAVHAVANNGIPLKFLAKSDKTQSLMKNCVCRLLLKKIWIRETCFQRLERLELFERF